MIQLKKIKSKLLFDAFFMFNNVLCFKDYYTTHYLCKSNDK